jgi:predicted GIY-YIG superfamily endonuclease
VEGNSFATSHRGPWKLVYYEAYVGQADALGRERYLKSGAGRRFLKAQLRHYLSRNSIKSPFVLTAKATNSIAPQLNPANRVSAAA